MLVTPIPRPSAHIQEAISAGEAPNACAAWKTSTPALVKPTNTVTKPAITAEMEKSFFKVMISLASAKGLP